MAISKEQRERRRLGITGSDAPAILGASPFKTPLSVWLDKKQPLPPDEPDGVMKIGNALESYICEEFTERTGAALVECDTIAHPEHAFIIGHPDRLLAGREEGFEAKLVAFRQDDWGPPDTDLVPAYVHLQVDHYMLATGFKRWHIAAQLGLRELRLYTIERDEAIMAKLLRFEQQFWRMVQDDIQPPMMAPGDVARMYPFDKGTAVTADAVASEALATLRHARVEQDAWKDLGDVMEAKIKAFMADDATLTDEMGTVLATWKRSRDGNTFDADRFRIEHGDLYKQYLKPKSGARRFLLK